MRSLENSDIAGALAVYIRAWARTTLLPIPDAQALMPERQWRSHHPAMYEYTAPLVAVLRSRYGASFPQTASNGNCASLPLSSNSSISRTVIPFGVTVSSRFKVHNSWAPRAAVTGNTRGD